jgi:hypothetical protein
LKQVGSTAPGVWNSCFRWFSGHLLGEGHDDIALGAFDCKRTPGPEEEWATCERRINRAAGELMPEPSSPSGETT